MTKIDLEALRIADAPVQVPRRPIGPRLLTIVALLAVLGVALTFAWPFLWPGRAVRMANIRMVAVAGTAASSPLAEAVGWVEADPFPTVVHPLVTGRIASLDVLEGTRVVAGETVLAQLESADLIAAKERAAASCLERDRMLDASRATHELATARLAQNKEAKLAALEARAALAEKDVALAAAEGQIVRVRAEARAATAAVAAQEQLHAAGSSNTIALERVRAAAAVADAAIATAEATARNTMIERQAAAARVTFADELVANPIDLQGAANVAAAEVQRAKANCDAGRAELAIAERASAWATVKSPVSGVVLRLMAHPGVTVGPDREGVASIYDPARLRARIDVPLGSMGSITPDQEVELRSEVTGGAVVRGVVQRLQQEADLLKNTLQVKVRIVQPPAAWRPEMLCRARFLGAANANPAAGAPAPVTAFVIPKAALHGDRVFVFDPQHRRARGVVVTKVEEKGDDVVVRGELSVTQKVVLEPVVDGETIREETR